MTWLCFALPSLALPCLALPCLALSSFVLRRTAGRLVVHVSEIRENTKMADEAFKKIVRFTFGLTYRRSHLFFLFRSSLDTIIYRAMFAA